MTQAARDEIVARLEAVPGIGRVHGYQRYADEMRDLEALYARDGVLLGWFVRRVSLIETSLPAKRTLETAKWAIVGYMAVNDAVASELAFDALVDAIRAQFPPYDLNPAPTEIEFRDAAGKQTGAALEESGPVLFAGVLCHYARLTVITRRFIHYPRI